MLLISTGRCNGYTKICRALVAIPPYPYAIASSGPIRSQAGLTLGSVPSGYDPTKGLDLSKLTPAEMMTQGQDDAGGAALVIKGKSTVVGKVRSAGSADVDLNQVEVRGEIVLTELIRPSWAARSVSLLRRYASGSGARERALPPPGANRVGGALL